ncbi:hypothetical protein Tco_1355313 [Tanacetum coccineum]
MNPQEIKQVTAHDEKWVPSAERVKISSTNLRLETTVPQKEETFQVLIDIIKNSTCFKAFTISTDVPEIFMQQFWYTIKKVQGTDSYEFLLAKKCRVDAEVFRKILDICPRVESEEFAELQNDDDTLTFLIDLGYKGQLHKYTNMYVDHMSQPWRTLAAIINKCLSGKTASNDRLKKSRINIMWGMFYRENVDYPELICEDFAYQIDHRRERKSRRKKSYQMFIKYSTGQIPPKKSRSKGSQGKKTIDDSQETVDVSEESKPKHEHVKKKTVSKSISLDEAEEEEAAKQVHATHARILTESAKKKTSSRSSRSVVIQDTPCATKSKPAASKPMLKGVQSLTPQEQEAANVMQALKESKKTSSRQPGTGGSSEGTGRIPGVPDESTVISATTSEGTVKDLNEEEDIDWIDFEENEEKKDDTDDDKSIDLEMTNDEETDDEVLQGKEQVNDDEDEEILNAKVEDSGKGFGDQFLKLSSDTSLVGTVKDTTDAEISSLLDIKIQSEVLHIQSPSVLKVPVFVISEPSILTPVQETPSAAPVTTLPPPSVSTIPPTPLQQNNSTNLSTINHDRCSNHHLYCT